MRGHSRDILIHILYVHINEQVKEKFAGWNWFNRLEGGGPKD